VDPADALERIVYLLDRGLAAGHKVKAFQRARGVIVDLPPGELDRLWREGRLTELPGIGATTGQVIAEALAGEVPGYVAHLEEETVIPLGEGAALRAALRGDCHTHSTWSDGGASIENMARAAMALGHEYIVLTDHSPRLTVARGLSPQRLARQLEEVATLNEALSPFRILTGMEVDILEDGRLDLADDLLAGLDVVVASVHSKVRMPRREMT
jgi:putative hydrolase